MLVEVMERSQIMLPDELMEKMGISEGDKFEVMERDGGVFLCPVVMYPEAKLEYITQIMEEHEKSLSSVVYESVEDMFDDFGIDIEGCDV